MFVVSSTNDTYGIGSILIENQINLSAIVCVDDGNLKIILTRKYNTKA